VGNDLSSQRKIPGISIQPQPFPFALPDLLKHRFEEARELYADEWLGFSEAELEAMLEKASFTQVTASVVDKEPETPQFQTLLGMGKKQG
jgi:ArsR family transcriptional regulator